MRLAKKFLWASFFFLPLLAVCAGNGFGAVLVDDYTPEVTARVARISFIRGDVQIRRASDSGDKAEWERAALNLPLVEGDELATGANTVVEIQLDGYNHIRLWENAYLKFTTLRDEGVAVSLPQGTMSYRSLAFDKAKSYFEIDAPETTVSIDRAGMYRIDAGDTRNSEIRLTATENGEAKVYTQTSGFTLRSGRTARIFIEGNYAGDYETADTARTADEFDDWVLKRDSVVAKRLNEAYYDKYYDRDVFGAEDLNGNGEWIYTKKYGYVWKPYPNTLSPYAGWTPYRYGHWRWVPFYGWTWIADEPWGWATYHYGRWVWDSGYWAWTPYANYRWRRSWWQPAMVSIVTWNGRVIWFPLGYDDDYCDFNRGFGSYRRYRGNNNVAIINNNTTIINNPLPNPSPSPNQPVLTPEQVRELRRVNAKSPSLQRVPLEAVVETSVEEFGKQTRGYRTAPVAAAKEALAKPIDENQSPPLLPEFKTIRDKVSKEILIENPRLDEKRAVAVKTGASEREPNKPLDEKLEKERIFGNRQPVIRDIKPDNETRTESNERRKTGAIERTPVIKQENNEPGRSPDFNPQPNFPARTTGGGKSDNDNDERRQKEETRSVPQKPQEENRTPPIIYQPQPQRQPEPQKPQEEERRPQPTFPQQQRQEERRKEEPRPQPQPEQRREEPKREEPKREEPRPQPKQEEKPAPSKPTIIERKSEKDS
ncbi:MAG TPA: DUF6600 domain-containing protein [Pyrinomonadaceae bacterium]